MSPGPNRDRVDELIVEIRKLTSLDASALVEPIEAIEDPKLESRFRKALPKPGDDPLDSIQELASMMREARRVVEAKEASRRIVATSSISSSRPPP